MGVAAFVVTTLLVCATQSWAQTQQDPPTSSVAVLPRGAFHMTAEHLSSGDPRFVWDANFGGDLDFVDYGAGRVTFVANYQAILGRELRAFDPNQGNYILGGLVSGRVAGLELAAVFHHESRHLSDRAKRDPVDWNMVGGAVLKTVASGRMTTEARADLRGVIQRSFVDYEWELDARATTRYAVRPAASLFAAGDLRLLGVDGSANRGTQTGFRGEGGVRVTGRGAAVELFLAGERRIDPSPLEFGTETWFSAGFRLLSK